MEYAVRIKDTNIANGKTVVEYAGQGMTRSFHREKVHPWKTENGAHRFISVQKRLDELHPKRVGDGWRREYNVVLYW